MTRRLGAVTLAFGLLACQPAVIEVSGHEVACFEIDLETCRVVAAGAINSMARAGPPTGQISAYPRASCPRVPDWADGNRCWQVYLPSGSDRICMVIARGLDGHYGKVAGDNTTGIFKETPKGCPP